MNINLRTHALRRAATCRNLLAGLRIAVSLAAAALALPASARTVYDAGKALRENFQNNATPANPYTDENGGVWKYSSSKGVVPFTDLGDFKSSYATVDNGQLQGWGGSSSPHLKVNITGHTLTSSSFMSGDCEPIEADEMVIHPGQTGNSYMVLRFIAPEDGWYSAFASFHDTSKETTPTASSGASVAITLGANNVLARGIVSIEGAANSTRRFDFQMPVRYMTAGTEIRFAIGNNAGASGTVHANDGTGVKVFVTKEDEGAFYDSGLAMAENLATRYENPFGDIAKGTWYYLVASTADASTAPSNVSSAATARISTKAKRSESDNQRGFANNSDGSFPYVLLNEKAVVSTNVAPGELHVHPSASDLKKWPVIRFRPPLSGYYSGSIVARDLMKASSEPNANGVDVYLYVADTLVTNANVSLYSYQSTAHFTFDSTLMAAGEPVDIVVSASGEASDDGTGISAIFRRENGDIYDAGKSYYDVHAFRSASDYFSDSFDSAANWLVAKKSDPWAEAHDSLSTYLTPTSGNLTWWTHATGSNNNGTPPRFAMATNGIAGVDNSMYLGANAPLLSTTPCELVVNPNAPSSATPCPSLRAEVPSNGIYRVRSYFRDLIQNRTDGDGIMAIISAGSHSPASAIVSRDVGDYLYEKALSADRIWLKKDEALYFTIDPRGNSTSDATGLSACYEICDASPSARVINIDFGVPSSVTGRFSNYTGAGREGWSDWNKWNALRISNSTSAATVSVDNCREADGMTKRNVTLTLARTSGTVLKGFTSGGSALHNNWAQSDNASDTYTFTLSKLKADEPYTLYLYSAKGGAAGNASFTVGGVTKTADEPWNLKDTKVVARFDVASDSNGEISGTFAAADANGGAFNGLTLVGEFPDYVPEAFVLTFR